MDCISLLSATIRFIDLHDSDRGHGESPNFSRESRPGKSDGYYLDIAMLVVESLKKFDDSANQEYFSFISILKSVREFIHSVEENDVMYVINVLRRPTEIHYFMRNIGTYDRIKQSEKKKTAIIEKTDYADEYRLSQTGKMFPLLANAAHDAIYLQGDACNLLKAVEIGEFNNVKNFSEEIIGKLRNEILDIRSALEKVGKSETIDKYISNFIKYIKTIDETKKIIINVEEKIDSQQIFDEFQIWQEKSNSDITFDSLYQNILRIRQVIIIYSRLIADLISISSQDKRISIPPPSFRKFAISMIRKPLKPELENFFLQQWGAIGLESPFYSFLDGIDAVDIYSAPRNNDGLQFVDEEIEPISRLGKLIFLDNHGEEITKLLRKSPLKLSDAIGMDLFVVDELFMLGDLVGVFVAPDSLRIGEDIEIRVNPSITTMDVDGGDFLFTDLEISIKDNSNEQF